MKQTRTEEVLVDDQTGLEIRPNSGWEVRGIGHGNTYHFQSLTLLAAVLLNRADIFGVSPKYVRGELERNGLLQ